MTEAEWLACMDPMTLGRVAQDKVNTQRFRWLALDWGERNRRFFCQEDLDWLGSYSRWLHGEGPDPKQLAWPLSFYPLIRTVSFDPFGMRFFYALRKLDDPIQAAFIAGECASQSFQFTPLEPLPSDANHKGRSKSKRAAHAARVTADFEEQHRQRGILRERVSLEFCNQFRDVAGNPFRPVVADPAWLTPKVVAIATAIYADRAFDRMLILADALEEAGCTNADVLLHCRSDGPHVRGCWVVDLLLGKE